jgi:hypothetical protein
VNNNIFNDNDNNDYNNELLEKIKFFENELKTANLENNKIENKLKIENNKIENKLKIEITALNETIHDLNKKNFSFDDDNKFYKNKSKHLKKILTKK